MTFSEISDAVFAHPKILEGLIQHSRKWTHNKVRRTSGGGGAWDHDDRKEITFRVWLRKDIGDFTHEKAAKGFAEAEGPDVVACIVQCFEKLQLSLPESLLPLVKPKTK